ncbi:MAG: hypothetical protein K1000chlam3_00941 [Chlamydiae bacterium]|nr:hypothetical protein [Chlamydiota bacterium]
MIKFLLFLLLFAGFSICGNIFWFYSGSDFSLKNFQPPVEISYKSPSIDIPSGPYAYLGHGKQSMVFESADQSHVLKLFYWKRPLRKRWYRKAENWLRFASPSWLIKTAKKRGELKKLFTRYVWGFEDLRTETAIVHVHFSKTKEPMPISLIDRNGKSHPLNLADFPFVLQKKIVLIPEYLDAKLRSGDILGAKQAIANLREYFARRIQMGYIDNPEVFAKNYGFIGDQPVQIDIGRFAKPAQFDVKKEQEKVFRNLDKYVRKHYPQLI